MGTQRTTNCQNHNAKQSNIGERSVKAAGNQPANLDHLPMLAMHPSDAPPRIVLTAQNILQLQRTVGNQAVSGSLLSAAISTEEAAPPELLEPDDEHSVPEQGTLTRDWAMAPRGSQWSATEVTESRHTPKWGNSTTRNAGSTATIAWGTGAAHQAIAKPQPVSWGANPVVRRAKSGQDINEAIVGAALKSLMFVQHLVVLDKNRLGATTWPVKYKAPQFSFNTYSKKTKVGKVEWYAKPKLTQKAYEGDSNAYYIGPGLHKTLFMDTITKVIKGKGKKGGKVVKVPVPVFWEMSKAMSNLDRDAENEHSNDHKQAYKISLNEAQTVLNTSIIGKTFGPKTTKAHAKQMVLDTITKKLIHPKLGNDQTKWADKYKTLFLLTLTRDAKFWHTFDLGPRKERGGKVIRQIQVGTTKINVVKSKTLIKY